jgi:hypothetical protein
MKGVGELNFIIFAGGDGFFHWEQAQNIALDKPAIITSIYPLIVGKMLKVTDIKSPYLVRLLNYFVFVLLAVFSMYLIKVQSLLDKEKFGVTFLYRSK